MKKNFFKKLSFVLALAMVLSVVAPAAAAFAAAAPKLNSVKKYLHLDAEDLNEFNFNVKNKKSGWKYSWESSNEDVVSVNAKNGVVTATGVGTAKVTVFITDKKNEEVKDLTATVIVRDNIKEVTITNKPEGDKLAVGAENDFNRSFVTNAGSTKKTSAVTRWTVEPADGATIADNGVFVATKAGKYTVTANAFQSKAKFNSWKKDAVANAGLVLATDTYEVNVSASMVSVKQTELNKFAVTFDTAMTKADVEKNVGLSYVAGTSSVKLNTIKEVTMNADNTVATFEVHGTLTEGATYVVDYPELGSLSFVAASTKVAEVVRVEITTTTAQVGVEEDVKISLYNANNVNIASADLLSRVEVKSSNNATYVDSANKKLTMYKIGDTTTLTAIFHTYEYDDKGVEKGAVSTEQLVTCVDKKVANAGLLDAFTVTKAGEANFGDVKHKIAADDAGLNLYVKLKGKEANGWQDKFTTNEISNNGFKFTSTNQEILIVDENTGAIYPVKEGSGSIVVTYNDVVVGAATITVVPTRKVATVSVDNRSFTLSNDSTVLDTKTVKVSVKDQLGSDFDSAKYTVATTYNGVAGADTTLMTSGSTGNTIVFNGATVKEGTYTYTVVVTDTTNWSKTSAYITVNVAKASSVEVVRYAVETAKEYDMKVNSWDGSAAEDVTISVFGYSANNVRVERVNLGAAGYTLEVKDPHGTTHVIGSSTKLTASGSDAKFALVSGAANAVAEFSPTGSYIMTVKNSDNKVISTDYFSVKNTQVAPTYTVKKLYTDKTTVADAINDTIEFKINGATYTVGQNAASDWTTYDITTSTGNTKTFLLKKAYIYEPIGNGAGFFKHEVSLNVVINYAQ